MIQRFQLYFPVELYLRLRQAAEKRGVSIAEFVRGAVEKALGRPKKTSDPLDRIVGKGRSRDTDLSYHHDKYLYGWVKDAPRKGKKRP